jgi:hypothetical protein
MIPDHVRARNAPPLKCYYCAQGVAPESGSVPGATDVLAAFTAHDKRGCRHVCFGHASWLMKHSFAFGHSPDCPYHEGK